jgi:endonuclease/exonuclease/phosphatase family metal-dependent hydrolase
VETEALLHDLNDSELDGRYSEVILVDGNDPRGIDVGVLSKLAFESVESHKDDLFSALGTNQPKYTYARDALELQLVFNGRTIVLFGVHFKAKENDDPQKRLAEAQHTRGLADTVTANDPATAILVLGDYNDTPGSPPCDAVVGEDPDVYVDSADQVAEADRWTFDFQGSHELVDHQMASPLLAGMRDKVAIQHGPEAAAASDHAPIIATYQIR